MVLALRHPRAWLVIGWSLVVLAVIASLAPGKSLPSTGLSDKLEHALAYTLLTVWFAGIYPRSRYFIIGFGLFCMGLLIEWAQGAMNLGRVSDAQDVIANTAGIVLGLILSFAGLGGWAQRVEALARRR
jgi:VanZ family protein